MSQDHAVWWAMGLAKVFVIATALSLLFAFLIRGNPAVIEGSPLLSFLAGMLSLVFSVTGPVSFLTGVYVSVKFLKWSVWKPLITMYAVAAALFLLGEFLFPH